MASPRADVPAALRRLVERVHRGDWQEFGTYAVPPDGVGRPSAVLIVFSPVSDDANELSVLLIERASHLRNHAGQIAFPGGSVDPGDVDPADTALREAKEEVGLDGSQVHVLGELPELFIVRSGFRVVPVVAWWPTPSTLEPVDRSEVAAVKAVPIAELADPANRFLAVHPSGYRAPAFEVGELFIWGFTANVLDKLLAVAGWEKPWDRGALRQLPEARL